MKLLEDISSTTEHRPPERRPTITLAVTGAGLAVAALLGVILMMSGGGDDDHTAAASSDASAQVPMSTWVEGVSQACTQTAADHPILTQGEGARTDPDNVVEVDAATRDLAVAVRGVALPTESGHADTATEAVRMGDQADQAWYSLAGQSVDRVTQARLAEASSATSAFASQLANLGASSCGDIS